MSGKVDRMLVASQLLDMRLADIATIQANMRDKQLAEEEEAAKLRAQKVIYKEDKR